MPRKVITSFDDLPRPVLKTPEKGSAGDKCDQSQADACSLPNLMQKYAGNLAEIKAWQSNPKNYGKQLPNNLEDALETLDNGTRLANSVGSATISEAISKLTAPQEAPPAQSNPETQPAISSEEKTDE